MPLIASISGVRGVFGDGLDPATLVRFASAYGTWCRNRGSGQVTVVVGRDARVTGELCSRIVVGALQSVGCHVIDAGLATTPTVEMAVLQEGAQGGIVLSASHNPAQWNALKFFNEQGEFLTPVQGAEVLALAEAGEADVVRYDRIGRVSSKDFLEDHIDAILALSFISAETIGAADYKIVVDGVNSVGGIAIPELLRRLGVKPDRIVEIHCEPTGLFAHDPEPLPGHLEDLMDAVASSGADLGIAVDPDADRLALVEAGGEFLGEELTQVLAADFMWSHGEGPFATNLSSSRTIDHVAATYGQTVYRTAVGEANVVVKMKEVGALIGGEGNGGVILPDLHYGRDALVGVAIALQTLAERGITLTEWRSLWPRYGMAKQKVALDSVDPDSVLRRIAAEYADEDVTDVDGVKIDFENSWVHLRKSNTEPIIRVYAEAATVQAAEALADRFVLEITAL
ncbi:MAG TPA: phosphoglucosamine mutase [Rhodothermales bacterium]|nr:phosphoglucosamine mutase [Rhodothermales bacterium]